jgi:hypothetical protein
MKASTVLSHTANLRIVHLLVWGLCASCIAAAASPFKECPMGRPCHAPLSIVNTERQRRGMTPTLAARNNLNGLLIIRGGDASSPDDREILRETEDIVDGDEKSNTADASDEIGRSLGQAKAELEIMMETNSVDESEESGDDSEEQHPLVVGDPKEDAKVEDDQASTMKPSLFQEESHALDDGDSSAFVDRLELADAYDEGDTTSFENDGSNVESVRSASTRETALTEPETTQSTSAALPEASVDSQPSVSDHEAVNPDENEPTQTTSQPPAASSEQTEAETSPAVAEIITPAMKVALRKLGYGRGDISRLKPSIAAVVIEKKLMRPIEGLPDNWYLPGKAHKLQNKLRSIMVKVLLPLLAAAVAIKGGIELDLLPNFSSESSSAVPQSNSYRPMTPEEVKYYTTVMAEATGKVKPASR